MYDSVKREKNEINMRVSKQNFAIEVEGMKAVCPLGEVVGKKMIAEEKIPVISCEGGCFRGEIARMTETSEITTSFADSTLAVESIRAAAKTVEETHLIVVPGEWSEAVIRKSSDMTTPAGQRIPLCPHRTGSTLKCDADRQSTIPNLTWVDYLLIIGLSVACALVFNRYHSMGIPIVPQSFLSEAVSYENPSMAFDKHKKGKTLFVDAMPYIFYEQKRIAGAVSLPVAIFDFMYDMSIGQTDKSKEIIVYGRTISKRYDEEVASNLVARGHKNVKILEGGLDAWREKHYPVEP